jgi:hypothetical protein
MRFLEKFRNLYQEKVNPVRKDGALTPTFLLGIDALFYIIPAINGGAF